MHRLGLKASVLLRRFVHLYLKYSDDQPRDERGRWVETDGEDDDDLTTGGINPLDRARTGDPEIDEMTEMLEKKLAEVVQALGPGSGALYGIKVHSAIAASVRAENLPGVLVETSWFNRETVVYGYGDSIRTDVALQRTDGSGIRAVWDIKTGNAYLSGTRIGQIRAQFGSERHVPVIEINALRGTRVKATQLWRL